MEVLINGNPQNVAPKTRLTDFLQSKGLDPKTIVVEYNEAILAADAYFDTVFHPGDRIEVLRFVGGG